MTMKSLSGSVASDQSCSLQSIEESKREDASESELRSRIITLDSTIQLIQIAKQCECRDCEHCRNGQTGEGLALFFSPRRQTTITLCRDCELSDDVRISAPDW